MAHSRKYIHYWMIALEELSLPIIDHGCMVEEQVSEKDFSKLLVAVARKDWGKEAMDWLQVAVARKVG